MDYPSYTDIIYKYSIFDRMIEGVQVIDRNMTYVYVNDAIASQGKSTKEALLGQRMTDMYPGIEKTQVFQNIINCLENKKPCSLLNEFHFSDGTRGWFDLRMEPVDEGLLIMSFDVTAQKEMEFELRKVNYDLQKLVEEKSEELIHAHERLNTELEKKLHLSQVEISDYKHALDVSCIVAITDQKGIIHHVNENFCSISKYSREELIGQDHRIINSAYHPKEFIRNLWVTIARGQVWRGELKNKAKDGTYYWVDTTIVPFLDENGKPYQYLAIRSDITQRKLAEEQLVQSNEELENKVVERTLELTHALEREKELNEMKSRFVSMASHEFRTPLSAILSSISLVEHYLTLEQAEKRQKHVDRIKASVKNLTSLLDDFLSLEKLEQGKVETHTSDFDLAELLEDVVEEMDGMLKKKYQTVKIDFQGEKMVHQDKKILRNIFLNLVSNAVKYSGEWKEILVTAIVKNKQVSISVRDQGIGIPEEAQKHLFGKFFRAGNATNIQGTGLGLNIVKRYVELLDGNISFSSKENQGSTFTVDFPAYKE